MNTIKFNNNVEVEVDSYNKNTYFSGTEIISNGSCSVICDNTDALMELGQEKITNISIYHDDTLIYNLQNIHAHIDNINEYLNGDRVSVGISLTFDTPIPD